MAKELSVTGPVSEADKRAFRNALGGFATGVAIVTTRGMAGEMVGLTINSFASVSLDPPLALWSLSRESESIALFGKGSAFSISVLTSAQRELAEIFASPRRDRFRDVTLAGGENGAPIIDGCLAWFECIVQDVLDGGDHVILLGRVTRFESHGGAPLIFQAGQYQSE